MARKVPGPVNVFRVEVFWEWFATHEEELRGIRTGHEPIIKPLRAALRRYCRGLTWECSVGNVEPKEFIVSAEGNRKLFPAVKRLVGAAPDIPGWTFLALRQPKWPLGLDFLSTPAGSTLNLSDIWFIAKQRGRRYALIIGIKDLTEANDGDLTSGSLMLIDALLGEQVVATRIRKIGWVALPPNPELADFRPLRTLPDLLAPTLDKGQKADA